MRWQRTDLGAGVGKAQDVKPIEKASAVGYRKDIYNSMRCISVKNRDTRRYIVSLSGSEVILELERVIGRKIHSLCGEGEEGLKRGISQYKGIGGVYVFVNLKKDKVYVGSSSDLSARLRFYVSRVKINKGISKDTKRGWDGFMTGVVLKEDDKTRREDEEYSIIRKVKESLRFKIYNVFVRKEDKERYGVKVTLRRRTSVTKGTREKMRKRMKEIARERGYGERQRGYWFKKGEESKGAKRIWVIDIVKGIMFSGIISEVIRRVGGSYEGVGYARGENTIYKGRYIFRETQGMYAEVIIEDTKTGEIKVVNKKDAPTEVGGKERGVLYAIKRGNKYKGRYRIRDIKNEEKS